MSNKEGSIKKKGKSHNRREVNFPFFSPREFVFISGERSNKSLETLKKSFRLGVRSLERKNVRL